MFLKYSSLFLLGVGVFLMMQVITPLVSYKVWEIQNLDSQTELVNAVPETANVLGVSIRSDNNFPSFEAKEQIAPYDHFSLTVPKLGLKNEEVEVYSNNFDLNLAQLPGTALPGEVGNVFISGHSSILLNNPLADKKAIFYNLSNLKKGDQIFVEALGQQYQYKVQEIKVVKPEDLSVINPQEPLGRYLTLMTCVPPGFNTKRLIVLAELVD